MPSTRRPPRRQTPAAPEPPDPLTALLRQAAARAEDPVTRKWLERLLDHGEAAQGRYDRAAGEGVAR
jgi:hypothetical protein